jgi:hypothetical protein
VHPDLRLAGLHRPVGVLTHNPSASVGGSVGSACGGGAGLDSRVRVGLGGSVAGSEVGGRALIRQFWAVWQLGGGAGLGEAIKTPSESIGAALKSSPPYHLTSINKGPSEATGTAKPPAPSKLVRTDPKR